MADDDRSLDFETTLMMHPDRQAAVQELHARPPLTITASHSILHAGFRCDAKIFGAILNNLDCYDAPETVRHHFHQIEGRLTKLERHTEFTSLTICDRAAPSTADMLKSLAEIVPLHEVTVIVLTQVDLCKSSKELVKNMPFGQRSYGGTMRGQMDVRSNLVPDENGVLHYYLKASEGSSDEIGRRVQRLLDMDTYRTMCLLGLSAARRMGDQLQETEGRLHKVIAAMNSNAKQNEDTLFDAVSRLSQESNAMQAETRFRFSASRAYFDLTIQRLGSLEENKFGDLQTLTGFIRSRLDPAMATIESVSRRQDTLAEDISSALSLLRTRIDLRLNRDNQSLLKSMDDRHRQQVLIAQAVEGLSTVAITYYSVGLISYVVKGLGDYLPFGLSPKVVISLSIPIVLIGTWTFLRRMHSKWSRHPASSA